MVKRLLTVARFERALFSLNIYSSDHYPFGFAIMRIRAIVPVAAVLVAFAFLLAADKPEESVGGWKGVQQAIDQGRPKTAIERLEPVISEAISKRNFDLAVRGVATRVDLQANIQGNSPAEKITQMKEEIETAGAEMKPVLQCLLAQWYWQYFQQNRWRFAQRTEISDEIEPADDFTTWDLNQILSEIDRQFQTALANPKQLQQIAATDYDEFLQAGSSGAQSKSSPYRPTLYDVMVQAAIDFYNAGEQGGSKSQDAFILQSTTPVFDSLEAFLAWKPESAEVNSPLLKSIALFQDILRFHQTDEDRTSRLDWDLQRYRFGFNHAVGSSKNDRYQAAMQQFATLFNENRVSARAVFRIAQWHHENNDYVKAHAVASDGLRRHPSSVGGNQCFNLIKQIEAKDLRVETSRVWNEDAGLIQLSYRNVTKIHFRLVKVDYEQFLITKQQRTQPDQLSEDERKVLLAQTPTLSWESDLAATDDYQLTSREMKSPADIPLGCYLLLASHQPDFGNSDNQLSVTTIWRSNLALITRSESQRPANGSPTRNEGFVLDSVTGNPLNGVAVEIWESVQNAGYRRAGRLTTNVDGRFDLLGSQNRSVVLIAKRGGDLLASSGMYLRDRGVPRLPRDNTRTVFFTDRSIYRPGQTVQFKGICYSTDVQTNRYTTIPSRPVSVVFRDVNGQEIEKRELRTNDFGSFSGSFTAPRDRLMGRMSISCAGPQGSTSVQIEEYKRPKFRVDVGKPDRTTKLGEAVAVDGTATAYTGVPIDSATVKYRVVRKVRYSPWWYSRCWWMPISRPVSVEIANGTTSTDSLGRFKVEYTAKPDESVDKRSEPTFSYTVYADVTDTTGETRSDSATISLGYSAISATLSAADWLTDHDSVELNVRISGLQGDTSKATGQIKVYALVQPESVQVPPQQQRRGWNPLANNGETSGGDASNPESWDLGEMIAETNFQTTASGSADVLVDLPAGFYRAVLSADDGQENKATAYHTIRVLDLDAETLNIKTPFLLKAPTWTIEPGQSLKAVWGSGYESTRVFVEIEHRGEVLKQYWTDPQRTQGIIEFPVDESMRGGITLRTTMVRNNRAHLKTQSVDIPWSNKKLDVRWERFVSKLQPGQKETWTAIIEGVGEDDQAAIAEVVASLYDSSLDAYLNHSFPNLSRIFRRNYSSLSSRFQNGTSSLNTWYSDWKVDRRDTALTYWRFPDALTRNIWNSRRSRRLGRGMMMMDGAGIESEMMFGQAMPVPMSAAMAGGAPVEGIRSKSVASMGPFGNSESDLFDSDPFGSEPGSETPKPNLDNVAARKNLNETAFFLPHSVSSKDGLVTLSFTMPEALTEWKLIGFAHDSQLRSGAFSGTAVTSKDLMVQPNPPRFVREGDQIEFTVKVSNQSPTFQSGTVRLSLSDARTGEPASQLHDNGEVDQSFEIPAGQSKTLSWKLSIPDGQDFLTYKAVGSTGRLSDGEEGFLPVLSRRVLVIESLPLPIRGKTTKDFAFGKLIESGGSDSLKHQSLTVQMVSNPSWYAVMALPYLMEYPHECSEQTFNRFYANTLASHIVNSDPKIERVFASWRSTPALDSPLQKNEDLKSVTLLESPWLSDAKSESQSRRDVGLLFDSNRLNDEMGRAKFKLAQMQLGDGSWPWFDGGKGNSYLTLYITTGFGRLRHLGVNVEAEPAIKSLGFLDDWAKKVYDDIKPADREKNHLSSTMALYLYGRSFFLRDKPIQDQHREAISYWTEQAKKHWLSLAARQSQGQVAVALNRLGTLSTAKDIMVSLKERSVNDDELGMSWVDGGSSWWWYNAPIETQAMMIEAFDEVMNDQQAVEDCKVWMLKQKQTQNWKTTKATADAIYALLLRGSDMLASDALVEVALAGQKVEPQDVEAGTGFYQQRLVRSEIEPAMGQISVRKIDDGVAWGSVHWQYLEDISKVTPHDATPLKLSKSLYIKRITRDGPKLVPVDGPVSVGDELVVRIQLQTDRDMEFVHMKDHRGSGTEPMNVLSGYRYQDGLGYYESTRDTASHFFIDFLPKGTYVFEYSSRVQLRGNYQTGFAHIECMYAPEFDAHSESLAIEAR